MKNFRYLLLLWFGTLSAGESLGAPVLWTYDAGSTISFSPSLGADGTAYLVGSFGLMAVTNSGVQASNKWTFSVFGAGSPTIGSDGTIYLGDSSASCNLRAIDTNGVQVWALPLQAEFQYQIRFQSSPSIGRDGSLYFVAGGHLYSVSASGTKQWESPIDDTSRTDPLSPVLGGDGRIYVGSTLARTFYSFNPDGTTNWISSGLLSNCAESAAIGRDCTVYVAAGLLYAFDQTGSNLWSLGPPQFNGSPVAGTTGTIYASTTLGHILYSISPGGQINWQNLGDSIQYAPATIPAVDGGETLYFCVSNSLYALNSLGQVQWSIFGGVPTLAGGFLALTSPAVTPNGVIYAVLGQILYAISGTNSPSAASWPMYKQNSRRTGKIEKAVLKNPQKRSDANFQFQLYPQQIGLTYNIEMSTNFNTWTSLTSIVATTLPTDVADLTATNAPFRFYRASSSP